MYNKMIKNKLGLLLLLVVTFVSCEKETRNLKEIEDTQIQEYLRANNLSAAFTKDTSGFYYQIIEQGDGEALDYPSAIYYLQDLKTLDGGIIPPNNSIFITSSDKNIPSADLLGYVKPLGFREAIKKVNKGGRIRALIPSNLAFGKNGIGTQVKGNSIIDATFDVLNAKTQVEADNILITRFRNLQPENFIKDSSGVYYHIINQGAGEEIRLTSTITAIYTGKFLNGTVFDSSTAASPFKTQLNENIINGWRIAIPKIKKGGKLKLLLPAYQAYGSQSLSGIPPNAPLQFDIEIVDVTN